MLNCTIARFWLSRLLPLIHLHMRKVLANSEEELFSKIKDGDVAAFDALYGKYWQKAFSEAHRRLRNTDQAKDIVQDIFLTIWLRREVLAIDNFPAYLTTSIRNQVFKLIEKEKHTHPFFDKIEDFPATINSADNNILYKELAQSYHTLVDSMPAKRQLIFKLRYQEGRSTKEIAEKLSISRNTVQNQLGKAVEQLKSALSNFFLILLVIFLSNP
jgi:RNA polymerase sigma-19 factor, ECF subfamily